MTDRIAAARSLSDTDTRCFARSPIRLGYNLSHMSNLRSRRDLLRALGASAAGASFVPSMFGQGRCQGGYNTPGCPMSKEVATAPIKPLFAPTGWKTVALEQISFQVYVAWSFN